MELCLGMGGELAGNLWIGINGQTEVDNVVVSVRYRLPNQEEVDEAAYRQLK